MDALFTKDILLLGTSKLLAQNNIATESKSKAKLRFFVSDEPAQFKSIGEKFLGRKLNNVKKAGYGL